MPSPKLIYVVSDLHKSVAFEWLALGLPAPYAPTFVLLNPGDSALEQWLREHGVGVRRITYRGKRDLLPALVQLIKLFRRERPTVIHTHLFMASLLGLLAGRLAGVSRRVHTRHHATEHHQYHPRAVWYDRFVNYLATDVVAISQNVRKILLEKENVPPTKITLIHHGFQLTDFQLISADRVASLRQRYQLAEHQPVVGVIARYTHWKGIQYIIPAFARLLAEYPYSCLLLTNAAGNYTAEIQRLLAILPPSSYREIRFEEDIFALYQLMTLHVHVPIDAESEAFGQTYVEALAAGIPSVFTLSGVAPEFILHRENAWVVPFQDADAIHDAMRTLLADAPLRARLATSGKASVAQLFSLQQYVEKLTALYHKTGEQ